VEWLWSPDSSAARWLIERGLAAIYVFAFLNAFFQFPALLGERGLLPSPRYLRFVSFRRAPSLFHLRYSDRLLRVVAIVGVAVAGSLILGLPEQAPLPVTMAAWLLLWALYVSIVNIGQEFYAFGWESLLCECGFLAVFLGNNEVAPPLLVLLLFRWVAFRLEFGAGLIKLRGDPCWRALTCMDYHHETQPMPNPLSWFFHHLPRPLHRIEAGGNFVAQLAMPFLLFLPQPLATIGALVMIMSQLYLVVSGNYAWLNWLTIVCCTAGLSDAALRFVLPIGTPAYPLDAPLWFAGAVIGVTILVVILSYWPARNLLSRHQVMNASFDPLHLVNTYGAFGSVTRRRNEVVVEGTADEPYSPDPTWREYEFKGKPTSLRRVPWQVAPYHLRLDWLMWFAAISPGYAESWFVPFLLRLLENDRPTTGLLRRNPFRDTPPRFVRARLYRYRFSTWTELRTTRSWWVRQLVGEYVQALDLDSFAQGRRRAA
jgi:hypothetical protein